MNTYAYENLRLFEGIDLKAIEGCLQCLHARKMPYKKGQDLTSYVFETSNIVVNLSGTIHCETKDIFGNTTLIETIHSYEFFGFSSIKIAGVAIEYNAVEDGEFLLLDLRPLFNPCKPNCEIHKIMLQNSIIIMNEKTNKYIETIIHLSRRKTKEKVLSYLSSIAMKEGSMTFEIPLNRQQLADFLCVDRAALSVVLSELKKEGTITFKKNTFTILNEKDDMTK